MKYIAIIMYGICVISTVSHAHEINQNQEYVLCFSTLLDLGLQVWDDTRQLVECYDPSSEQLLKDIILGRLTRLQYEIKNVAQQLETQDGIVMVSDLEFVQTVISYIEKVFFCPDSGDASSAIVAPLARSICADIQELI